MITIIFQCGYKCPLQGGRAIRRVPKGLSGSQIPLGARLFMVIDTLDAITSDRPYRKANSFDIAKAEILRMAGSQFDPETIEAFSAEEETLRKMVIAKCYWASPLQE